MASVPRGLVDGAGGETGEDSNDGGDGGGGSGDEEKNGGISSEGLTVEGGKLGEGATGEPALKGPTRCGSARPLGGVVFFAAARHRFHGRRLGRLRWREHPRQEERQATPSATPAEGTFDCEMYGRWFATDVERFDCSADQGHCAHRHDTAKEDREHCRQGQEERFGEKAKAYKEAGGAERAQNTDFVTASNDRDGDGVVDEKCADN